MCLAITDGGIILNALYEKAYGLYYLFGFFLFYCFTFALAGYADIHLAFSEKERKVDKLLFIAILVPGIGILTRFGTNELLKNIFMPGTLFVSMAIIFFLIKSEKLIDTMSFLHENLYDKSDTPIFLFDTDFFYLDSNAVAKELYPFLRDVTRKRHVRHNIEKIYELSRMPEKVSVIQEGDVFYRCQLFEQYSGNTLKGYVVTLIDISKEKTETQVMENLKKEAEQESLSKSRFLARMSHDLRSPMHSIIEVSDMLVNNRDISEHNRILLRHVKSSAATLLELINSMLEFSKLESGKLIMNERMYYLENMIEELAKENVMSLHAKPVHFAARIEKNHPKRLFGDDIRVREIIQNLLSNAVKFTNNGKIECNITTKRCSDNRVYIVCKVRDSGSGMSQELIDKIIHPDDLSYYEKKKNETGIGFSVAKQIVTMLGGKIEIESDGKSYTTAIASFYQNAVDEEELPEVIYSSETILSQEAAGTNRVYPNWLYPEAKILVADDMRINRVIFGEIVEPWKCEVDYVVNGMKAIEAVKNKKYHMIFIDQMMPNMTGTEAAVKIKEVLPDAKIILMTGDAQSDTWEEARDAGFTEFLAKPFDMADIQKILEQHLPKELKIIPNDNREPLITAYMADHTIYRKVLKTFASELTEFYDHLNEYLMKDLDTFRIKVHGVKGVCKQIGKADIAESAEIMEMAAKANHMHFIEDHLEKFKQDINFILEQISLELEKLPEQKEEEPGEETEMSEEELWKGLKEGFDSYDLDLIEQMIKQLRSMNLTQEDSEVLKKVELLSDELEYEEGSKLLENVIEKRGVTI